MELVQFPRLLPDNWLKYIFSGRSQFSAGTDSNSMDPPSSIVFTTALKYAQLTIP